MSSRKRIQKQILQFTNTPPIGTNIVLKEPTNIYQWILTIQGKQNTPYEDGIFNILVNLPLQYPFKPPKFKFYTKIFHLNINQKGDISFHPQLCCSWSPALTIQKCSILIRDYLQNPQFDNCLNLQAGQIYKQSKIKYQQMARNWTQKYAKN